MKNFPKKNSLERSGGMHPNTNDSIVNTEECIQRGAFS